MSESESEFDTLIKLHTEIKSFKIKNSVEILRNFRSNKQPKFKLTAEEKEETFLFSIENEEDNKKLKRILTNFEPSENNNKELRKIFNEKYSAKQTHPKLDEIFLLSDAISVTEWPEKGWIITDKEKNNTFIVIESDKRLKICVEKPSRLNLSSTTVCAYALSQYFELWDEAGISKDNLDFKSLEDYYNFIIDGFKIYLERGSNNIPTKEFESTDEFCLINILSLLKEFQKEVKNENNDFKEGDKIKEIIELIRILCKQFIKNRFSFREKPHPFIYYKFLSIIQDWEQDISKDIEKHVSMWTKWNENDKNEEVGLRSFVDKVKKGRGYNKAIFDYFFNTIYAYAKYEMYRQIALYNAEDFSLFDVKRLIYSLLITKLNDKYSNNLIKNKVLELIFKQQLKTGLFPIGHVVNTDFVIEEGVIKDKTERRISASPMSPILSSVECLKDMLLHDELRPDLEKYQKRLNSTYEWILRRLMKDSPDKPLGWFPEYESTHTPESWVAGHTLIFLKKYCEMLSELIEKNAGKELQAKKSGELTIEWEKLKDSYEIKRYIGDMTKTEEKGYLFSWDDVSKGDVEKLLHFPELRRYLMDDLDIDWAEKAEIRKSDDGKAIRISNNQNSAEIKLNDTEATLKKINGDITLKVKKENGKLNIYEKRNVVSNYKYRSALIFGPPGSGKSTIAKALAKRLGWDYVELSPSLFLSEGDQNIIPKAIEIFKRLVRMKETVIFFDEVDQLVKSRKKSDEKSVWIVTSLLPLFQKLREQNDIKFILATNDITEVDTAAKRPGRIDAVLPMGAICWRDRLKILRDAISDENDEIKEQLKSEESKKVFEDLLEGNKLKGDKEIGNIGKDVIKTGCLQDFSRRTDYMPFLEIKSIVERLFNKGNWKTVKNAEAFKILFGGEDSGSEEYENSEFKDVHEKLVSKSMKTEDKVDKYVYLPMEAEISKGEYIQQVKKTIFRES